MPIRRLPPETVNRIAAGEVVERPASAVKELVENALDAGATRVEVQVDGGGLSRILVSDDGRGLAREELPLAVERHATSKLAPSEDGSWDLLRIATMGFRGEALPSIGSVARLSIESRAAGERDAWAIAVDGGLVGEPGPCGFAGASGARVEVRDLFYATPARLKFMKSQRAEAMAVSEEIKRQAMARHTVGFALDLDGRRTLRLPAEAAGPEGRLARLSAVLGPEFKDNAIEIDAGRDGVRLSGFAGLPTYSRGNAAFQHLFVNGRPVKDRLLQGALRGAYADFLARDRHPTAALYVELDPEFVDVNVHPAKTEVRFRDPALVRGLIVGALKHALAGAGQRASTTVAGAALEALRPAAWAAGGGSRNAPGWSGWAGWTGAPTPSLAGVAELSARVEDIEGRERLRGDFGDGASTISASEANRSGMTGSSPADGPDPLDFPLGAARAQLHETYVVAQTRDGIVIVDQHAAHERLVYERLKRERDAGRIARQTLLIPEVVELDPADADRLAAAAEELDALGLALEPFGAGAVLVRETPAALGACDVAGLVRDLADDLAEQGQSLLLKERIDAVLGDFACRTSVRSGRRLSAPEMNALLREMEATPHSGQCNHGRPTYVELKLADVEKLFGRR